MEVVYVLVQEMVLLVGDTSWFGNLQIDCYHKGHCDLIWFGLFWALIGLIYYALQFASRVHYKGDENFEAIFEKQCNIMRDFSG